MLFLDFAVLLHNTRVESVGNRSGVIGFLYGIVISLHLCLSHAVAIKIVGGCGDDILRTVLINALRHDRRIEDYRYKHAHHLLASLPRLQR